MRRWFVILLIALLPWRAWAGDAMMLSLAAPADTAAHCADHPPQPADPTDHAAAEDPSPHAVCDVCNGPALAAPPPQPLGPEPLPQARRSTDPERFASALPRAGHKPPIS